MNTTTTDSGMSGFHCPKCGKPGDPAHDQCIYCGIIFERYQQVMARQREALRTPVIPARRYGPIGLLAMKPYARFFRHVGRLVDSGISLAEALRSQAGSKPPVGPLAEGAVVHLEGGQTLCGALQSSGAVLPSFVWGHLEAGEVSGRLPELMHTLAEELETRRGRILRQIFNWRMLWFFAMLGFAAVSLSITGSVGNLGEDRINQGVSAVLAGILIGAIPGLIVYLGLFGLVCFGFAWFQIKGKDHFTERSAAFERFRLRLPFFSRILIEETLARYLDLLSKLLESGLSLPRALQLAREDVAFPEWRCGFDAVREIIESGGNLAQGLQRVPHVPPDLIAEVRVGEATGGLTEGITRFARYLRDEAKTKRVLLNTGYMIALFLVGILLTVAVLIRGMGSWMGLYERVLF